MKHMWEAKLNSSRAVQSNDDLNTSPSVTSGGGGGSTLKLPTQPPTPRSVPQSTNVQSRNGSATTPATPNAIDLTSNSSDVKPSIQNMDPHTLSAIQTAFNNTHEQNRIKKQMMGQVDGHGDGGSSSDEDEDDDEIGVVNDPNDDDDNDDADDKTNNDDQNDYEGKEDPDPLNSGDDLTEPGSPNSQSDLFDTEHVIVCQYDKVCWIF